MKTANKNIIHRGNSIISVETHPDYSHPVVIKKPAKRYPSRRSLRSLEKEYEMTRSLNAVEGVRKAMGQQSIENRQALILEYIDGETLRDHIGTKPLSLWARLDLAIELARILREIHQQKVIHLDLNSKNILVGKERGAVHFIDLGSASYIDRSGYQKVLPDQVLGTLSYIAPEQTGRINRAVDERSDLYSLGAVLYELFTGQVPFDSKDPMTLVHNHIAREPVAPAELSPEVPDVVSAIIMKLLEKNAEQRYQTAGGLAADLQHCCALLRDSRQIELFPLGEEDIRDRLRIPDRLYRSEEHTSELQRRFDNGLRRFCLAVLK